MNDLSPKILAIEEKATNIVFVVIIIIIIN